MTPMTYDPSCPSVDRLVSRVDGRSVGLTAFIPLKERDVTRPCSYIGALVLSCFAELCDVNVCMLCCVVYDV